jgi:hypothetical protein
MTKRNVNSDGTEPPRQRAGKSYPGGKHLRKAFERLSNRRQAFTGKPSHRMPGSMKK